MEKFYKCYRSSRQQCSGVFKCDFNESCKTSSLGVQGVLVGKGMGSCGDDQMKEI